MGGLLQCDQTWIDCFDARRNTKITSFNMRGDGRNIASVLLGMEGLL